ncbi:MAG: DUF1778 domain-containing protein, partial [Spirochaetales bacterium]|nr:DUF1778 domain-containing protein [Spirochaetales bacterium]
MAVSVIKNQSIYIRTDIQDKIILRKAAELNHVPLSSYIINAALRQAQTDLMQQENIIVSNQNRNLILSALDNPPAP